MRNEGSPSILFKNPFRKPQLHFLPLTLCMAESLLSVSLSRVAYQLLKLLREGGSCLLVFESSVVTINHHKPMRSILSLSPFYR